MSVVQTIENFTFQPVQGNTTERDRERFLLSFTRRVNKFQTVQHNITMEKAPSVYEDARINVGSHYRYTNRDTGAGVFSIYQDGSYFGVFLDLVNSLTYIVAPDAQNAADEWLKGKDSYQVCSTANIPSSASLITLSSDSSKLYQQFGGNNCFVGDDDPHYFTMTYFIAQPFVADSWVGSEKKAVQMAESWVLAMSQVYFLQMNFQVLLKEVVLSSAIDTTVAGAEWAGGCLSSTEIASQTMLQRVQTWLSSQSGNYPVADLYFVQTGQCDLSPSGGTGVASGVAVSKDASVPPLAVARMVQRQTKNGALIDTWHTMVHQLAHLLGAKTHIVSDDAGVMSASPESSVLVGNIYQFHPQSLQEVCSSLKSANLQDSLKAFDLSQLTPSGSNVTTTSSAGDRSLDSSSTTSNALSSSTDAPEAATTTTAPVPSTTPYTYVKYRENEIDGYSLWKINTRCMDFSSKGYLGSVSACATSAKNHGMPGFSVNYKDGYCKLCHSLSIVDGMSVDVYIQSSQLTTQATVAGATTSNATGGTGDGSDSSSSGDGSSGSSSSGKAATAAPSPQLDLCQARTLSAVETECEIGPSVISRAGPSPSAVVAGSLAGGLAAFVLLGVATYYIVAAVRDKRANRKSKRMKKQ